MTSTRSGRPGSPQPAGGMRKHESPGQTGDMKRPEFPQLAGQGGTCPHNKQEVWGDLGPTTSSNNGKMRLNSLAINMRIGDSSYIANRWSWPDSCNSYDDGKTKPIGNAFVCRPNCTMFNAWTYVHTFFQVWVS